MNIVMFATPAMFDYLRTQNTQIARQALDYLDNDYCEIVLDGRVWWMEINSNRPYPNAKVFAYFKRVMHKLFSARYYMES